MAFDELLRKFPERLTAAERRLADLRAADRGWTELSAELNVAADALRKQ